MSQMRSKKRSSLDDLLLRRLLCRNQNADAIGNSIKKYFISFWHGIASFRWDDTTTKARNLSKGDRMFNLHRNAGRSWRPCEVDGRPARFHTWASQEDGLLKINVLTNVHDADMINKHYRKSGYIPSGCSIEKIAKVCAVIEEPDGTVRLVPAEKVRFTDREGDNGKV